MGDSNQLSIHENCTSEDFLWIASVIGSKISESDIADRYSNLAVCLGISSEGLDMIGDDHEIIQQSFLLWKSENEADFSREKLLQCLERLQDSSAFMEKLRERYSGEPQVANDSSGILIHLEDQNIPSGNDSRPIVSQPPSNADLVELDHVAFSSPVPIEEAVGKTSKMLVCGQCTDIRSAPELFTKREVTQKIAEMEEKFSTLVSSVQLHFQSFPEEGIQAMKSYLTSLSMSVREDVSECVFTSQQVEIITYSKLPKIFQWLTINGIWSFLNIYLLEKLVDTYSNSDDLKQRVATFKEEMQHFKKDMKLADFLPAWSGRCPHVPSSGFAPIILRVNKDWGDCTLGDVADMEGFLESRFLINRFILRFANGHYGSVVIMWLVPAHAIAYLKKRILAIGSVSLTTNQVEVKLGGNFTVKASSISIQEPNPCTAPIRSRKSQEQISKTLVDCGNYDELYTTSTKDPDFFWGTLAKQFLQWEKPFEKVEDCSMEEGEIKWFTGGKLNVSVNCVDRHAKEHPDRVALIWEKDEPDQAEQVTYKELLQKVCQIANVLKSRGVKKGDIVVIYMPACPLTVASMLACTRIGAVHSVLFSKFALVQEDQRAKILKERTAGAKVIITANKSQLSGRVLPLKESLEILLESSDSIQHVLVYKRTDAEVTMKPERDEWLEEAMEEQPTECEPESMDSEDDLFVMFTSGVEKTAKGIVHSQAGYLLHVAVTFKYYFDYQPGEIFACTADIGWITGHSYVVYGPLCNGATTVLYDSTALYPSASRFWEVVERLKINHFYTTPSVIQKLMSLDKDIPNSFDLSSLRVIASVGECLNKEAWNWFHKRFGDCKCRFIDTWWQTELGGIAIAPHPKLAVQELKPGFIMKPSFGVKPRLLIDKDIDQKGNEATGKLYLEAPLPGMGRRLTGDEGQELFKKEYFTEKHDGKTLYYTSDVAHRDKDGDYQIYSRANDAIRYRGELLNLPIIEGAANVSHESIEETVLVLDLGNIKENATTLDEPNVIAHVQLKDALSPNTEEDVMFSVQESIEQTSRIEKKHLQVKIHQEDNMFIRGRKTFSGKTTRQALMRNNPDSDAEYDPLEDKFQALNQGYPFVPAPLVSVK